MVTIACAMFCGEAQAAQPPLASEMHARFDAFESEIPVA